MRWYPLMQPYKPCNSRQNNCIWASSRGAMIQTLMASLISPVYSYTFTYPYIAKCICTQVKSDMSRQGRLCWFWTPWFAHRYGCCADTAHSNHPLHCANLQADVYVASVLITEQGCAKDWSLWQQYSNEHHLMVIMVNFCGVSGGWEAAGKSCICSNSESVLAQAEATADMCDDVNFQLLLAEQIQGVWQATSHAGTSINS